MSCEGRICFDMVVVLVEPLLEMRYTLSTFYSEL